MVIQLSWIDCITPKTFCRTSSVQENDFSKNALTINLLSELVHSYFFLTTLVAGFRFISSMTACTRELMT
jgi:hypothetical protein